MTDREKQIDDFLAFLDICRAPSFDKEYYAQKMIENGNACPHIVKDKFRPIVEVIAHLEKKGAIIDLLGCEDFNISQIREEL